MSWIKDNKFAAMLGGATLVAAIGVFYIGLSYRGNYAEANQSYQDAAAQVEEFESLRLYPSSENRHGKSKALNEYRDAIIGLQASFDKFRPKELKNIPPQEFTDHAKAAKDEVTKAFEEIRTELPEAFFLGFEGYTSSLASGAATGLLDFQLGAVKELMLDLAKARPSQLQNVHRPKFPEEDGAKWQPGPDDVARPFPIEVSFKGPEKALREFISALLKSPNYFFTVRSLRIMNEMQKPPLTSDAKFDVGAPAKGAAAADDPFGGAAGFELPGEGPEPGPAAPGADATPAPAPAPAPAAPADTSRILNPVLGSEELQVFLRIDVLQFLPASKLPEVPK